MRRLSFLLLLVPCMLFAQENQEYMVFENALISVHPAKTTDFEKAVATHNKTYHADETYGARVYWVANGPNVGKYVWAMGPLPWSAMDSRPSKEGHDDDWNTNVLPHMMAEGNQTYWKFHADKSHFPANFELKNLWVRTYDIKRFKNAKAMELATKIHKTIAEKMSGETFGVYTNEFASMADPQDIAFVNFFDNSGWIGQDGKFAEHYDAVHGEGSFQELISEWESVTNGMTSNELWIFRPDLSGLGASVDVAQRQ